MTSVTKMSGGALYVLLTAAAVATADMRAPLPGAVNDVEGQATLNGEDLSASSAGQAAVAANQVLDTGHGKVELLLAPGVFLRVGDGSELRMISPYAPKVALELVKGGAILEVDQFSKGITFSFLMDGATANIAKPGLYLLAADQRSVGVLAGEAAVYQGNSHLTLKTGRGVFLLAGQRLKSQDLDPYAIQNEPLYIWSRLRSGYMAQANIDADQAILAAGGTYDAEWFWDTSFDCYAFLPLSGIEYSPFGWGFSSPGVVGKAPNPIHYPIPIQRPKPKPLSAAGRVSSARPARSGGGSNSGRTAGGGHFNGGGGHMGGGGGGHR